MRPGATLSEKAYIGIGSNLGDDLANCLEAVRLLDELGGCRVEERSSFYRTEPVGVEGQAWYLNAVVCLETERAPLHLLQGLLAIETKMGRVRKKKWDARLIDLDLLLYGDRVINQPDLTLPHPRMHERRFVLVPIAELAPNLIHPVYGKSMCDLLENCPDEGQRVFPVGEG